MTTRARVAVVVVLALLTGLFGLPIAGALYQARDAGYSCLIDVAPRVPELLLEGEAAGDGRISLLPLGLECTFTVSSGEQIVVGPGWLLTFFACAAGAFGLSALVALFWPAQSAGRTCAYRD